MAIGLGFVFWMLMLFSPLAFVGQANAADSDADNYGTVIGIVRSSPSHALGHKQQLPFMAMLPLRWRTTPQALSKSTNSC